jgi:phenylpropionate dioxygenase-like ring-hydroxylating dioxygenase large terminal subunit
MHAMLPAELPCRDINPESPYRFTLLGIPLVIWYEPSSQCWRAFKDICPHRLVPLSEGRVNAQGMLECGYHGWAFQGDGVCKVIPQVCGESRKYLVTVLKYLVTA